MEEWLSFFDTYSAYVLYNLDWSAPDCAAGKAHRVEEEFEAQWSLLRRAVLFITRHYPGRNRPGQIASCRAWFREYASRVQKVCVHTRLPDATVWVLAWRRLHPE